MTKQDIFWAILIIIMGTLLWVFMVSGITTGLKYPLRATQQAQEEQEIILRNYKTGAFLEDVPLFVNSDLAKRIVFCESGGNPKVCNDRVYCNKGMGLFGIISGTWNSTLVKMAREDEFMPERCWNLIYLSEVHLFEEYRDDAIFDPVCNSMVGLWLLENEGWKHWGTESASWGSYNCFKDFIPK